MRSKKKWKGSEMPGPLEGVRVVEFANGVAGPLACRFLGDAGADVIKAEDAPGDYARFWYPQTNKSSAVFNSLNRNKRSICISSGEMGELIGLANLADVLVIDSDVVKEYSVEIESMMQGNPRIVICVISGWGPEGPWANRAGGELPAQLASEVTSSLGTLGEEPVRLAADHGGALAATYATQAIIAALIAVDARGGQRIDVSLFGSLLHARATMWVALSNPDEWGGFHHDSYVKPPEHNYTCKDRRIYISIGRVKDKAALVRDLGMDFVFHDPRWPLFEQCSAGGTGKYAHLLHDLWDRGLAVWDSAEAADIITRHGGWVAFGLSHQEFLADAHVREMGLVVAVPDQDGGTSFDIRPPWQFSDTPATIRLPAPRLDQHGEEIRRTILQSGEWIAQFG